MTTLEVETYANEDGLSVGAQDVNLAVRLRKKVIPKFEADVGHAAWRRKWATLPVVVGTRSYDLPIDFHDMLDWPIYNVAGIESCLLYVGENAPHISSYGNNTTPGKPDAYWLDRVTAGPGISTELRKLTLNRLPDTAANIRYGYLWQLRFTDFSTVVDFDNYIPLSLQWALVEALKAELYIARFGIEDQRVVNARGEYDRLIQDALEYAEPGRRNQLKRMRQPPS